MYFLSIIFSSLLFCCEAFPSFFQKSTSPSFNDTKNAYQDVKPNEEFVKEYGFFVTRLLYGFGLTLLQIDAICILYVIYRTFKRWKRSSTILSMAYKLPFYMATLGKN